ncbi:antibiotic biosynthesis monooxygenase [uncultured Dokdonia sp.]|mgnify:CR=1 FL=1|uniref:antibiotic biosynthesis monooxygenase family protein n=1 Tax=Dokdonia sp. Asnod2-E02 TaxID=3160574 RepID=UPI002637578A|nr:antibiotic biosynthesis monooxygenase [uncultured Dokdonia sp.]
MQPPYYAVIFTSTQTSSTRGYKQAADLMEELAATMPGFLGVEGARNDSDHLGITVSYWRSLEDIARWKAQAEHQGAQRMGKSDWYDNYTVRICKVEREYSFDKS